MKSFFISGKKKAHVHIVYMGDFIIKTNYRLRISSKFI